MPHYMIRNDDELAKFAIISANGKKITWGRQESGTPFPTPEGAREAFDLACVAMAAPAIERFKADAAAGLVSQVQYGTQTYWATKEDLEQKKNSQYHRVKYLPSGLAFYTAHWLAEKVDGRGKFHVASRPAPDDLLGVFETFYVRSDQGWLGRPQRKRDGNSLAWCDSFGMAIPFSSAEAAQAELDRQKVPGHVAKTSCVFTQILPVGRPSPDGVSQSIASACEARDIETSLTESANARLADMRAAEAASAGAAAPKRAARL